MLKLSILLIALIAAGCVSKNRTAPPTATSTGGPTVTTVRLEPVPDLPAVTLEIVNQRLAAEKVRLVGLIYDTQTVEKARGIIRTLYAERHASVQVEARTEIINLRSLALVFAISPL